MVLAQPTKAARRQALPRLPLELGSAYAGMLARIQKSSHSPHPRSNLGMRVLMWLYLATRPLRLEELQHALGVVLEEGQPGNVDLDEDEIPTQKRLLDCCLGLVIVDEGTKTVRFVHYTLEEYFKGGNRSNEYFPDHHRLAAQICLTYLNFRELAADCTTRYEMDKRLQDFCFLDYAARYWGQYASQLDCSDGVDRFAMRLLRVGSGCQYPHVALPVLYRALYNDLYPYYPVFDFKFLGIHAAASFGLESCVNELGKDNIWNIEDNAGRTPLSWAAGQGHEAAVRLLVEREDVDADSKDTNDRTPLLWAAEGGHEAVVRLLVEREDVDADSMDIDGQTPLSWAAEEGHEAVVRLLIEREDVDADSKDIDGRTPLSWAAEEGDEAVVRLLVEREDVVADSKEIDGQTPLSWAAGRGHEAVVRLLVAREDVDADSKDINGRTPLSWAAERGREAVVRLLVEREDVDADSTDKNGRTPLSWAAERGHEAVVRLLVEREDVDANSKDQNGHTPLSLATVFCHEAVVRLLVELEDVDATSEDSND